MDTILLFRQWQGINFYGRNINHLFNGYIFVPLNNF